MVSSFLSYYDFLGRAWDQRRSSTHFELKLCHIHHQQTQQILGVHLVGDLCEDIRRGLEVAFAGEGSFEGADQARNLLIGLR